MSFTVDLDWLTEQAGRLDRIKDLVDKNDKDTGQFDGQLGSAEIADKLGDVMRNWSQKRKDLQGHLTTLATGAHNAVHVYQELEKSNKAPFDGGN